MRAWARSLSMSVSGSLRKGAPSVILSASQARREPTCPVLEGGIELSNLALKDAG